MNVILLSIDSFRWDRIGRNGYQRPLTPEIDNILAHSIYCNQTYTLSPSTTGAFPSIMTSTRPLSYGGFDLGILRRPKSLSTTLASAGYEVIHLTTVPWINATLGYSNDVMNDEMLYSIGTLTQTGTPLLRTPLTQYNSGTLSLKQLIDVADNVIPPYFENLLHYCDSRRLTPLPSGYFNNSLYGTQTYDWDAVRYIVSECAATYNYDKPRFMQHAAQHFARTGRWVLDRDWRYERSWRELTTTTGRRLLGWLIAPFNRSCAIRIMYPYKVSIDAEDLINRLLFIVQRPREMGKQFFIWTHLLDAHTPFTCGSGRAWAEDRSNWLRKAGYTEKIDETVSRISRPTTHKEWVDWCALYDASIRFVDFHIGRLRRALEVVGLNDTMIVITSDHGEELGEHGDNSHRFRLYEHNARVNTLYYHPDFRETEVGGFSTLMDIAPTVTDLASVARIPSGWEGHSLRYLQQNPRQHVVLETTFGSPSNALTSPVYLAARMGRYKLMYNESVHPRDRLSRQGIQLFDVLADPSEQRDIASEEPAIVARLMVPIEARLRELRLVQE